MTDLTSKKCVPCEGDEPPMEKEKAMELIKQVSEWKLADDTIERKFKFKNFKESVAFVNKVAEIAEQEGHHPDIKINWNRVGLKLTTHAIHGLSENDFIMAAKINQLLQ